MSEGNATLADRFRIAQSLLNSFRGADDLLARP